jgi:hypothetical protein
MSEAEVKVNDACPPDGAKVLDTQVGGHRYGKNGRKMGKTKRLGKNNLCVENGIDLIS